VTTLRVAAIDLGTNTTRLLVADLADGRVAEVERRLAITRLGEGVDARRRLLPLPIARVRNTLGEYRREAERLGAERVLLVATSAVRDAENGEAFLGEIEWSYGFDTLLLSGDDEAELTFRGVASRDGAVTPGTLVIDVGGGSTELVLGGPDGVDDRASLDVGSVRHTELYLHSDPPTEAELAACASDVREQVEAVAPRFAERARRAVGVAGTITTAAALDQALPEYDRERVDGHLLTRAGVDAVLRSLAALPLAERRLVPALEPERAPVMDALGLASLHASERDILHGAALAAAALPARQEGAAPPGAYTCC
jgi:exopolyphosphatase / guanosine-5'-triphosphate,3'-diphosphate pyrophosphatase